ncbi:MAG: hypothetical protein ACTHMG_01860 [Sphingomonas sp.]
MKPILATAAALGLAACSPANDTQPAANDTAAANAAGVSTPSASPTPIASASPQAEASPAADVLTLDGLGALRIGQAVPADSGWATRGAQESDSCRTVSSPDYPGVYAIVEGGKVRRISVGQRSDVKLIEGIGVGATEQQVTAAFPGFRATPHKYEAAPAKYLTAPNAGKGDVALRFEIGADGKVSMIHVGTAPALFYVEGCA